eukprot:53579_1
MSNGFKALNAISKLIDQFSNHLYSWQELIDLRLNVPTRKWLQCNKNEQKQEFNDDNHTIMINIGQFNCYAQEYTRILPNKPWMTLKCPRKYLQWEYRSKQLLFEILQYKLDIICIQEVEEFYFDNFYLPNLSQNTDKIPIQYNGIYLQKSKNHETNRRPLDGSAIFWNINKFKYKDHTQCILGGKACVNNGLCVRLSVIMDNNNDMNEIDVWTTHLKAGRKNKMETLRMTQTKILIENILQYSCVNNHRNYKRNIILCADLNSTYDNTHGVIPQVYPLLNNNIHYLNDSKVGMKLSSVWSMGMNGKEPGYTGWVGFIGRNVKGTLDYIFIGQIVTDKEKNKNGDCKVMELLNIFDESVVSKDQCFLPNKWYPSDHLLIAASILLHCS